MQQSFYGDKCERLLEIKRKWDPWGLFWAPTTVSSSSGRCVPPRWVPWIAETAGCAVRTRNMMAEMRRGGPVGLGGLSPEPDRIILRGNFRILPV